MYQQVIAVLTGVDAHLQARQLYEAMENEIAPNDINIARLKLKRLAGHGILVEIE
ncbi:hypothetical protein [Streptomyces sp. MBT62]|uniref:hypothetical protein n=1 Tax=Streptomyces sp. MBT62 TaxID=2800410 RepID=UPI00190DD075|nr:hypothetical protein [Streptomyces sp. MBT62]MBK3562676.1 hypothetical protein [Streptomyces sp. MBT62]